MTIKPASKEVFDYVVDCGGRVTLKEICDNFADTRTARSINGSITALANKNLVVREKVPANDPDEKDITYVVLTEDGKNFTPDDE